MRFVLAVSAIALGMAAPASASLAPSVPEINGASLSAGLALLAGGILMLRARRRR
jgi:hypothetical protein